ncbi:MAG: hypothetical protein MR008_01705 [Aerococcus sp.]|nr:hypothetical protein [Aerococcus sp.]
MENTYRRPWPMFPRLVKRADTAHQSKPAIPTQTNLRSIDELRDTVAYYANAQVPVYLTISRRMGNGLTCDTHFGTLEAEMAGQAFQFYDIDNDIHRLIPAEHLLMIKPLK